MSDNLRRAVALAIGLFILYTAAAGSFDALIQRSVMVALVVTSASSRFP